MFSDTSANGSQETDELGIGGVTVTLLNAGPDGTLGNTDDQVIATTTTAGDGSYVFNGNDLDANQKQDPGEPGIGGVPCVLRCLRQLAEPV